MLPAFVHGFILSLGLILPIGMQNAFIISQGALHNRWPGSFPAVITASICDTLLIVLAIIGVSVAEVHVQSVRYAFGTVGIVFILYMGWSAWRRSGGESGSVSTVWNAGQQIRFSVLFSLLNPNALLDTLVVIGGSALAYPSRPEKIAFGAASVTVSWMWFFGLSMAANMAGKIVLSRSPLFVLNRVSAVIMWLSAVYLAYIIFSFK